MTVAGISLAGDEPSGAKGGVCVASVSCVECHATAQLDHGTRTPLHPQCRSSFGTGSDGGVDATIGARISSSADAHSDTWIDTYFGSSADAGIDA
jgi:hypothetical protein